MSSRTFQLDPARRLTRPDAERVRLERARQEERWRRARALGIAATCVLHLLFFLLFRQDALPPLADSAPAGRAAGDLRAAGGGGSGLTMLEIGPQRQSAPPVEAPTPVPIPVPEERVIEPEPIRVEEPVVEPIREPEVGPIGVPSLPGVGGPGTGGEEGSGSGSGSGSADGDGTGDGGGGSGDGGAARILPPTPRGLFIPPTGRPASARGQEITVWVFVRENGRVDRATIRLEPPTSDSRYNQRLVQSVAEWVFDPARQGGRPVPAWYPFQIIL